MEFELVPNDGDVSVTVSDERLWEELGDQGILGDEDGEEYFYLAALALECREDNNYPIERVLAEFIFNTDALEMTSEERETIVEALR